MRIGRPSPPECELSAQESLWYWSNLWPAAYCWLMTYVLYVTSLPIMVTGEDSGEFIGAAYFLGIPHPPGYPTWCLMAHPFTWQPGLGAAYCVSNSSAFFGAVTVLLVVLIIIQLTHNPWAAVVGGLALAVSREFWQQAVIAEVYTLNTLFIAACLLLLLRWRITQKHYLLYAFALIYGLGWGVHNTIWVLGPVFALFVLYTLPGPPWRHWRTLLLAGGCAAAGLLVFLYLPLRAMADPPVNWGNPDNFERFWAVVTREQFQFMFTQYPRSLDMYLAQLRVLGEFWLHQFTWPVTLLGLAGLGHLCWRKPSQGLLFVGVAIMTLCTVAYAQNFRFDREWLWVMRVFGLPAYMMTAIGLGWILSRLSVWQMPPQAPDPSGDMDAAYEATKASRENNFNWLVLLLGLMVLPGLLLHYSENDKSDYYWASDYAWNILSSLPENAVFIPEADHAVFPVMYMQDVEGFRTDVLLGRRYGYVSWDLAPGMDAETRAAIGDFPRRSEEHKLFTWLLKNTARPVYFSRVPSLPDAPEIRFEPAGLFYRALRPGEIARPPYHYRLSDYSSQNDIDTETPPEDYTTALILSEIAHAQARDALLEGDLDKARDLIERGLHLYGGPAPQLLNNTGILCIRHGAPELARDYFERAIADAELARDPVSLESARRNLERLERRYGQGL